MIWTGRPAGRRMTVWKPPRGRCPRAAWARRPRVRLTSGGRVGGGVPPASPRRCRAVSSPPACGGRRQRWCSSRSPRLRSVRPGAAWAWRSRCGMTRWWAGWPGLHLPGLTGLMEAIVASTGSADVIGAMRWATLVALLALRRIRHLVVFVGAFLVVLLAVRLATVDRPRPFGVDLRGSWAGWAMPSRPVAIFAATLIGVLYTLVPVGRWRQLGKWVAAGLVAAFALARVDLGVDAPTDALVGAVIGVAVSVAAYRLLVPSEVFPVVYRRGRSAHLDVGGRRGEAIRRALAEQLGLTALEVEPFGLSGSAGSTTLRLKVEDGAGDARYVLGK